MSNRYDVVIVGGGVVGTQRDDEGLGAVTGAAQLGGQGFGGFAEGAAFFRQDEDDPRRPGRRRQSAGDGEQHADEDKPQQKHQGSGIGERGSEFEAQGAEDPTAPP